MQLVGDGLTEAGAIVGTPAYIAPERLQGGAGDEKSDQYSFAVALFEALSGQRPFATPAGAGPAAWLIARETTPARPRSMPRWVHRVLTRALAFDPASRHASMHGIIAALGDDPLVRARRLAIAGLAVVAVAGLGYETWAFTRPGLVRVQPTWHGEPIEVDAIRVDGREAEPDGDGRLAMEAGLHRIQVERENFVSTETIVEVVRGIGQDVPIALVHDEGRIDIEVEPRGATIVIDGVDHGSPLRNHRLDTGAHDVWIRQDGWYDRRFELVVRPDQTTRHYVALAPGAVWSRPESGVNLDLQWIGDIDGDGKPELGHRNFNTVTAHDPWNNLRPWRISFGDRRDVFTRWADLDGDGVQDLVSLHHDAKGRVLAAWSSRTTERKPRESWSVRGRAQGDATVAPLIADADADGDLDVVVAGLADAELAAHEGKRGRRLWRVGLPRAPLAIALVRDGERLDAIVLDEQRLARIDDVGGRHSVRWSVPAPNADDKGAGEDPAKLRSWIVGQQVDAKTVLLTAMLDDAAAADVLVRVAGRTIAFSGESGSELWRLDQDPTLVEMENGRTHVLGRDGDAIALLDGADVRPIWRHSAAPILGVPRWNGRTVVVLGNSGPEGREGKPGGVTVLDVRDGKTMLELEHELETTRAGAVAADWDGDGREELAVPTARGLVAFRVDGSTAASVGLEVGFGRVASTVDADGDGLADLLLEANGPQLVLGPRILWRRRSADAIRAQPVARDFDGDGRIELAQFAAFGGKATLHLLDGESGIIEASAEPGAISVIRAPAVIATEEGFDVVHALGEKLHRFSGQDASIVALGKTNDGYASPTVADLDGDGRLEVLAVSWDWGRVVRVFDADTLALEWSRTLSTGAWAEPLAMDLDDDVGLEVIVSQLDGEIVAFDGPEQAPLWKVRAGVRNVFPPLPMPWSDGGSALVTSAGEGVGTTRQDLVVLRARDGHELHRFAGLGHGRARAAASDVDGDGDADLVVGTATGSVVALTTDGDELWRHERGGSVPVSISTAIIAADLEHDGTDEILVGDDEGRLRVLDARTGTTEWSFEAGDQIEAPPLAVDVDLDGIAEVLVGSHSRFLVCLRHLARPRT